MKHIGQDNNIYEELAVEIYRMRAVIKYFELIDTINECKKKRKSSPIDVNAERQIINKTYEEGKITAETRDELTEVLNEIVKRQKDN
jgi:hypothetical protein